MGGYVVNIVSKRLRSRPCSVIVAVGAAMSESDAMEAA
jgi:hypothetical protein